MNARLTDECHGYDLDGNPVEPITVDCIFPPIPDRRWDFCAYRDPEAGNAYGFGRTAQEAINDFLELEAERA